MSHGSVGSAEHGKSKGSLRKRVESSGSLLAWKSLEKFRATSSLGEHSCLTCVWFSKHELDFAPLSSWDQWYMCAQLFHTGAGWTPPEEGDTHCCLQTKLRALWRSQTFWSKASPSVHVSVAFGVS